MVSTQTVPRHATTHGDLQAWIDAYDDLHIDLGCGDGRYALHLAQRDPGMAVLGIDTCLSNLTKGARRTMPNVRFLACDAAAAPEWLHGRAKSVSINFPFGSLFRAVVEGSMGLLEVAAPGTRIDIRVNASAGSEYGMGLSEIQDGVRRLLHQVAMGSAKVTVVTQEQVRDFPSTWAKRLGYGRPSQVIVATAVIGT